MTRRFIDLDRVHRTTGSVSRASRDEAERDKIRLEREAAQLEGDIASARLRLELAKRGEAELLAETRRSALARVAELTSAGAEAVEEIARLEDRLTRGQVRSPIAGRVLSVAARNPGQVLAPGELVAEIVPEDGPVFVEAELPADRVGRVEVGMEAMVKVLTYDFVRFGSARAVVDAVSASSFAEEDGRRIYRLRLRLIDGTVGPESAGRRLTPGMDVVVDIRGGSRTVLEYLLKPLRVVQDGALIEP